MPREERALVKRLYDADGRLTYESTYLNSELLQETHQHWQPNYRHLKANQHERTYLYQTSQLTELVSGTAHLKFTYDQSDKLESKTTPLSLRTIDYNGSGLPELTLVHLPSAQSTETLKWTPSGKLASYPERAGKPPVHG